MQPPAPQEQEQAAGPHGGEDREGAAGEATGGVCVVTLLGRILGLLHPPEQGVEDNGDAEGAGVRERFRLSCVFVCVCVRVCVCMYMYIYIYIDMYVCVCVCVCVCVRPG